MQRSGAAHAAHHFIENEQHAVAVADRADPLEVVGDRRHRARGRADHRLGHEGDDLIGPEFEDLVLERLCGARRIIGVALAGILPAIGVAGIDMVGFDQQRAELGAAPFVAAGCERAQRVAMIALAARDDVPALRFALLDEILPRHFQRGLDRFRSAAHEIDVIDSLGRGLDQPVGQLLGDLGREKRRYGRRRSYRAACAGPQSRRDGRGQDRTPPRRRRRRCSSCRCGRTVRCPCRPRRRASRHWRRDEEYGS